MSTKLFKKLVSSVAVLCLSIQGIVPVFAYGINSLPWSSDFNNLNDVTYTESFGANQTPLDCRLYSKGDELSVTSDPKSPEHGKVLKHKRKESEQRFLSFITPAQTSGKILFTFDVKLCRNAGFTLTTHKNPDSGWNPSLIMRDGKFDLGGGTTIPYEKDKWYTANVLIDIDNQHITCHVEGVSGKTQFREGHESIRELAFMFLTKDLPENSDEDGMYLDNVSIKKISSDGASIVLSSDGKEIVDSCKDTEIFKLNISNDEFTDSIKGLTLTDMGENPIETEIKDIPVDVNVTGSEAEIIPRQELAADHYYKLQIPETARTLFEQPFKKSVFEFKKIIGKSAEISNTCDFSDFTAENLSSPVAGVPVCEGSNVYYATARGKYEVVEDEQLTGGKGLKVDRYGAVYMNFPSNAALKEGVIKFEAKYKVLNGSSNLYLGNDNVPKISVIYATPSTADVFYQGAGANGIIAESWEATENGIVTAQFEINIDKRSIPQFVVNGRKGERGEGQMPFYDVNSGNVISDGIRFLRFEVPRDGTIILDYVKCSHVYEAPMVKSVIFTDENSEFIHEKGKKISPQISDIKINFSEAMSSESIDEITIIGSDSETVPFEGMAVGNSYVIKLTNLLAENKDYKITIPDTVKTVNGAPLGTETTGMISTSEGKFQISEIKITDSSGNVISDLNGAGNQIKIMAKIINTKGLNNDFSIVFAGRNGLLLKEMTYGNYRISDSDRNTELVLPVTIQDKSSLTSISGYLWRGIKNNIPLVDYVTVK